MQNSILAIQKQKDLLRMEYEAEKEEFRLHTEQMGVQRKVRRGMCWYPIAVGRSYYNSVNRMVVEVTQTEPNDIEHLFEYGKPVRFFAVDDKGGMRFLNASCQVSYVDKERMVVCVPSSQTVVDIQAVERLGVQLFFDETSYTTMFHALDDVLKAKNNRLEYFRDLFAGQLKPQKYAFNPLRFPWLNHTQERAVNEVLWAKDVAVVHGPPGTGKTTTLVEAIYETLRRETQVMVCAQSNMAVDWISEKLVDHGVPVLRIGNPTRVNDKMLSFTYERKFENHPDYSELWALRKVIRDLRENRKNTDSYHQKISRLNERAADLEMRINASLFDEARVVACTLVGSANKILVGKKFSTLFIDEAAQALEAACWIPLRRCGRVVFAGDHQQLPPTIKCFEAARGGLSQTLMERVVKNQPDVVTLLKVQYRMNDTIMRFSSDWFYGGQVQSAPDVSYRSILDFDTPMQWVDTSALREKRKVKSEESVVNEECLNEAEGEVERSPQSVPLNFSEQYVGENHGRINKAEAELTLTLLEEYIEKIGRQRFLDERLDVGVISPYKVQTQYLRTLIRQRAFFKPFRRVITVNTVDGFQGQERDIMMISLVRSNDSGQIGFLNDLRRMNVAITRARMKLIIIGDATTLSHHPFYRKLHEYITQL